MLPEIVKLHSTVEFTNLRSSNTKGVLWRMIQTPDN